MKNFIVNLFIVLLFLSSIAVAQGSAPTPFVKKYWIYASDYGLKGDGITDETALMQTFLDEAEGKIAILDSGKVYLVGDSLEMAPNSILEGNFSTIQFEVNNDKGLCLQNYSTIKNITLDLDTISDNIQTWGAMSGPYGSPLVIGHYGTGEGYHDVRVDNVQLTTERMNGADNLAIMGNSYNITGDKITILKGSQAHVGVSMHWGNVPAGSGPDDSTTYHPHNIILTNVYIDTMRMDINTAALSISGAYNIKVNGFQVYEAKKAVSLLSGDFGYQLVDYDGADIYDSASFDGRGIVIENGYIYSCSVGVQVNGATIAAGFSDDQLPVTLRNITTNGRPGDVGGGFVIQKSDGIVVDNCNAFEHTHGMVITNVINLHVSNSRFAFNDLYGAGISDAGLEEYPDHITFENCVFAQNKGLRGLVYTEVKTLWLINNVFGDEIDTSTTAGMRYGVQQNASSPDSSAVYVFGNYIRAHRINNADFGGFNFNSAPKLFMGNHVNDAFTLRLFGNVGLNRENIPLMEMDTLVYHMTNGDSLVWILDKGTNGYVLQTDGDGNLSWAGNAGTDITADLEEEDHASEHEDTGDDEIAVTNGMMNNGTNASSATYWRGDNTWVVPGGGGDVSKVPTPADDQVAVWTGDGTLEGRTTFTFSDADVLRLDVGHLHMETNVHINKDSTASDAIIYFGDDNEVQQFHWDQANSRFEFSANTYVTGSFTSTTTIEGGTITEGGVAVHNNDEMDGSPELRAIIDDETGGGVIVFNENPTIDSLTVTSKMTVDSLTADSIATTKILLTTVLGEVDAGGATSFEFPNSDNPTVDADGEAAWEPDDNCFRTWDGSANRAINTTKMFEFAIDDPDNLVNDSVTVLTVESEWAPFGIKLLSLGIKMKQPAAYSTTWYEYTHICVDSGTETALDAAIATSSTECSAEDDGALSDSDIAAGSVIKVILPATDISDLVLWGTFYIKTGD